METKNKTFLVEGAISFGIHLEENDIEAFIRHLGSRGLAAATRRPTATVTSAGLPAKSAARSGPGDDHDLPLLRQLLKGRRGGAGNRLGQSEVLVVLGLAEILGAKQLLRADDLGSVPGRAVRRSQGLFQVHGGVGRTCRLDYSDIDNAITHLRLE